VTEVSWPDAFEILWYGTQIELWNGSAVANQTLGQDRVLKGLNVITEKARKENRTQFDPPYILVNVTSQGISLVDPNHLCSKF